MKAFLLIAMLALAASAKQETYIISFKSGECKDLAISMAQSSQHKYKYLGLLNMMITDLEEEQFQALSQANDECIKFIEKDQMVYLDETISHEELLEDEDNVYYQWHLKRITQEGPVTTPGAFDPSRRIDNLAESHVYVIDSGIDGAHYELASHVYPNTDMHKGFNADICCGMSDREDPLCDCNDHGTHCAGLVGSETSGYNLHTWLHSAKVFNWIGSASFSIILDAMNWAGETHVNNFNGTPGIVSMSLGGGFNQATNAAVKALYDAGLTVIVAAGNSNKDACTGSPSSSEYAITVAASDIDDNRAYFSEYGNCVNIFAPGQQIYSTVAGNKFNYFSGTSMATPIVAGLASFLATEENTTDPDVVKRVLQCIALPDVIRDSQTAENLLSYHDYRLFNKQKCAYYNEKYPQLKKLLGLE